MALLPRAQRDVEYTNALLVRGVLAQHVSPLSLHDLAIPEARIVPPVGYTLGHAKGACALGWRSRVTTWSAQCNVSRCVAAACSPGLTAVRGIRDLRVLDDQDQFNTAERAVLTQ